MDAITMSPPQPRRAAPGFCAVLAAPFRALEAAMLDGHEGRGNKALHTASRVQLIDARSSIHILRVDS